MEETHIILLGIGSLVVFVGIFLILASGINKSNNKKKKESSEENAVFEDEDVPDISLEIKLDKEYSEDELDAILIAITEYRIAEGSKKKNAAEKLDKAIEREEKSAEKTKKEVDYNIDKEAIKKVLDQKDYSQPSEDLFEEFRLSSEKLDDSMFLELNLEYD